MSHVMMSLFVCVMSRVYQVDDSGVEQKDIDLVMQQANVSRAKVRQKAHELYIRFRVHTVCMYIFTGYQGTEE